mgnify:CR=1 FL=1
MRVVILSLVLLLSPAAAPASDLAGCETAVAGARYTLTYDPATERHERDDGDESPAGGERQHNADTAVGQQEAAGQRDAEIVATVIRRALAEGRPVALSGKNEPYNLRAPELAGWTRAQVRAAHRRALAAGLIENAAAARAAE